MMKRKSKEISNDASTVKRPNSKANQHWSFGLLQSMKDPDCKIKEDDKIVVIKDKYPKAKFHYLVIPKAEIPTIWHVKKDNEDLLLHMDRVGNDLIKEHKDLEFIIGYHAAPSMHRLHLHVISTDYNSTYLKTKCHWNSFTTPFFLHSADICRELRETGKLEKVKSEDIAQYLKTPLKCHKCSTTPKTMPELKRHLMTHLKN